MASHLNAPEPLQPDLRSFWALDDSVAFLNHGSFGAMPRCVFDEQEAWRRRIEANPVELLARQGEKLLAKARSAVGDWLGMGEPDFGFVTNATEGVNSVLRSLQLAPGDELLTTNHVYHAVRQAMRYVASRSGATCRELHIPLPVHSPDDIVRIVTEGLSDRTRLLVVDHVTSPTALIFPVERIVMACAARGVDVLIDGAHAPGMFPLHVSQIGPAYYAGNLHKWACGPKGTAFLWVRPDRQSRVHPLVISHHLNESFTREFGWQGTRDISGWLSMPRAIQFLRDLGFERVMRHNHEMAAWVGDILCRRWKVEPIGPSDGSMLGSMVTARLPPPFDRLSADQVEKLQQSLYSDHRIEVPVMKWEGAHFVRPCCQVYNRPEEYERLAQVIEKLQ